MTAATRNTALGMQLLGFVALTVMASIRILVDGGSCEQTDVSGVLDNVAKELRESDCRVTIGGEVRTAMKTN